MFNEHVHFIKFSKSKGRLQKKKQKSYSSNTNIKKLSYFCLLCIYIENYDFKMFLSSQFSRMSLKVSAHLGLTNPIEMDISIILLF